MSDFNVHILGCGSAVPTTHHAASSQIVSLRDKLYMIDCGEGTQTQMRRLRVKFSRLNHIFISHLHGDHCFGLPGLISTFSMLGRTGDLHIYAPKEINDFLLPILRMFNKGLGFKIDMHPIDPTAHALIMEDRALQVYTIPLNHRIPTCGFLFAEKPKEAHLLREMADFYQIPVRLLRGIKQGADYVTPEGEVIPNSRLTRPSVPPRRYAYCSDTAYSPDIIPLVRGVDLLYHEATFVESEATRASETHHSTAAQAAEIARAAGVKQLMLGHFSARYRNEERHNEEACRIFPNTLLANEGLVVSL